jgi:hypothetical protein
MGRDSFNEGSKLANIVTYQRWQPGDLAADDKTVVWRRVERGFFGERRERAYVPQGFRVFLEPRVEKLSWKRDVLIEDVANGLIGDANLSMTGA